MKLTFANYTQQNEVVRNLRCFSCEFFFKRPICRANSVVLCKEEFIAKFNTLSVSDEILDFSNKRDHQFCFHCKTKIHKYL